MNLIGLFKNENVTVPELPVIKPTKGYEDKPLGFKAYDGDVTVYININSGSSTPPSYCPLPTLYTSLDNTNNWTLWTDVLSPITVLSGHILYVKGNANNRFAAGEPTWEQCNGFQCGGSGKVDLVGNLTSLVTDNWTTPLDWTYPTIYTWDNFYALACLFWNNTHLYNAENCYFRFRSATYPSGPFAGTVGFCARWFNGCTNLKTGIKFKTDYTSGLGYAMMIGFYRYCSSLEKAELLLLDYTAGSQYYNRTLESYFEGCSSLTDIIYRGSANLYSSYYIFDNIPSTGTFHNLGGATTIEGLPSGWTIVTTE